MYTVTVVHSDQENVKTFKVCPVDKTMKTFGLEGAAALACVAVTLARRVVVKRGR